MKILTWNIGNFYPFQPWRHMPSGTQNVFFKRKDIDFVKSVIKKFNPDVVCFQELNSEADIKFLAKNLGFRHHSFSRIIHLSSLGTGILHNFKNAKFSLGNSTDSFHSVKIKGLTITNIHLSPFSNKIRENQIDALLEKTNKKSGKNIVCGDFNFKRWRKFWLNKRDKNSYKKLCKQFKDFSLIKSTHFSGFKLDYVFGNKDLKSKSFNCLKRRKGNMDHYPVFSEIS